MLPVEVVRHYQEIVHHLLDEIHSLQMERIKLARALEERAMADHAARSSAEGKGASRGD